MPARRRGGPVVPKLNLIPPHIAAAKRLTMAIIGTTVMIILILAGMGIWWQSTAATVTRLESELRQKTQEADQVRNLQQQAELIRSGVKALSDRLAIWDDIRQSGPQIAQLLRQISSWIPDGVRLTALQFQGGPTPVGGTALPSGMPGAPAMVGPEAMGAPGMPGMVSPPTGAPSGTQISTVTLIGYTVSLYRLADFYSHLSQSDLFSSVQLDLFEWNGRPYQGSNLPPILSQGATRAKAVGQQGLPPTGQPQPSGPEAPGPGGSAPPSAPTGEPSMGAHGGPNPMAAPGMGAHGSASSPMGAPGMGVQGGPSGAPPMMGMAPMGAPGMGMAAGSNVSAQIVRDPTAPRNAVYFIIRATLRSPLQIAPKLRPAPQMAAAGMPGGAMPPGAMSPGAMPPGAMPSAAPPTMPGARPSSQGPSPTSEEEAARGIGRRRGSVGEE